MGTSAKKMRMSDVEQAASASLADPRPSTVVTTKKQADAVANRWANKVEIPH